MSASPANDVELIEVDLAYHLPMVSPVVNFCLNVLGLKPLTRVAIHTIFVGVQLFRQMTNLSEDQFLELCKKIWFALEPPNEDAKEH